MDDRMVHTFSAAINGVQAGIVGHAAEGSVEPLRILDGYGGDCAARVRETTIRVRAALHGAGVDTHGTLVRVSDRVCCTGDLASAVAVLALKGRVPAQDLHDTLLIGELSLSGQIRPVRGLLACLRAGWTRGYLGAIVPACLEDEAALLLTDSSYDTGGLQIFCAKDLQDVIGHLTGERPLERAQGRANAGGASLPDMADIQGWGRIKRGLMVAAAGGHPVLISGPAGAGKTALARRAVTILPELAPGEGIEIATVASAAGIFDLARTCRPFRAPHHTVSEAGLLGGGADVVRPGEVTLAHGGVLLLDEVAEFSRLTLQSACRAVSDGQVEFRRGGTSVIMPAKPLLIAASNECPCGQTGGDAACRCGQDRIANYQRRWAPLRSLVQIHLHVGSPDRERLLLDGGGETGYSSAVYRREVQDARARQLVRQGRLNQDLPSRELDKVAPLAGASGRISKAALDAMAQRRTDVSVVQRLARTLADLAGDERIGPDQWLDAASLAFSPTT